MRVECFPGLRADQLRRVKENRDLRYSDAFVIHVRTNYARRSRNLDYIMGEVYDLVNTTKAKFPGSILVLSGILRNKGVKWRRVGAANDRLEWVARNLGATFVDPNSWIRDVDFGRDGQKWNETTWPALLQSLWNRRRKSEGDKQLTKNGGERVQ
jgi:hypothetical protein